MEHCRMVCGTRLKEVTVENGIMLVARSTDGSCADAWTSTLTFDENSPPRPGTPAYFRERLKTELNTASALSVPLRICNEHREQGIGNVWDGMLKADSCGPASGSRSLPSCY
jgi:hypothetical protein